MFAHLALDKLLQMPKGTVMDLGSGDGSHAKVMRQNGFEVTTVSYEPPADRIGDYKNMVFLDGFDYIWCSHFLEHQLNVNESLKAMHFDLKPGGWLFITVPPAKHNIVGGHVTLWNAGLLLYNLILAGFDCSKARVAAYDYNISVIVQKGEQPELSGLRYDSGDIQYLSKYFPFEAYEGFDGHINSGEGINW